MVYFYNTQLGKGEQELVYDPTKISWSANLIAAATKGEPTSFQSSCLASAVYRPFEKQHLYRGDKFINRRGQFDDFFPTPKHKNRVICISGACIRRPFSCIMTGVIPDLHMFDEGAQCFPLYVYTKEERGAQMSLFDKGDDEYRCTSGITDFMLERCRAEFGEKVTKEDISIRPTTASGSRPT